MHKKNFLADVQTLRQRARLQYLGDKDPATRRMLESILAVEEEHADELADLVQDVHSGLKASAPSAAK